MDKLTKRKTINKSMLLILGLIFSTLQTHAQEVIPDFYQQPGINSDRNYLEQNANESIDPFTGSLQLHYTDLTIPGNGGFDLNIVRSYNSSTDNDYGAIAGQGWTVHFGRILKARENYACTNIRASTIDNPVVELPDGSRQLLYFTENSSMQLLTTDRWKASCLSNGMAVYSPDGTRYDMTHYVGIGTQVNPVSAWYTTKITDKNGNYANITYNRSTSEIERITTNDGRSISFTYASSGFDAHRITSIFGAGKTIRYSYKQISGADAPNYFLSSVTYPDGTSWDYSYNVNMGLLPGSFLINKVNYPKGGYLNYTYGYVYFDTQANPSSRSEVITRKQSSSGGTWTFEYTPGRINTYDTAVVKGPSGTTTYKHIGPNYSNSGTVWMVGLLVSKNINGLQTETYTWNKQKISNENYFRPGAFVTKIDNDSNTPILTKKQITRNGGNYITTYSNFDSYGNPKTIAETGPNGSKTTNLSYYVNTSKWIVKNHIQNESFSGSSVQRSYDSNGNITAVNNNGVGTYYYYDSQGNISSIIYPRSLTHTYSYYQRGIARQEKQPENITISRDVSDAGNIISETDGEGKTTKYTYDAMDRMTSATYPKGNPLKISYTTKTKTATRGLLTEKVSYDGFANPTSIEMGGINHTYKYDVLGRMTFKSNPGTTIGTAYSYDALDRTTQIKYADGSLEKFAYGSGNMTHTSPRGFATSFAYRSYGDPETQHIMSITTPEPTSNISLTRNTKDQITSIKQGNLTRTQVYDSRGYLTSMTDPEIGTTTLERDAAGNMISRKIGSFTTRYNYDGQNRLNKIVYSNGTPTQTFTYDRRGKKTASSSSIANRTMSYDANSNLIKESLTIDSIVMNTIYDYDGNDNLKTITYPLSGNQVNYTVNALGRQTKVTGFIDSVTHWPSGQIKQINYSNGVITDYGQNNKLLPSTFINKKNTSTYLNSTYTYDNDDNLTTIKDTVDTQYNLTLGYDKLNRLITANGVWGSGTITYDGLSNITSKKLGSNTLSYSYANNKLTRAVGDHIYYYQYDALGNINKVNNVEYRYDEVGNLTCVACEDPNKAIFYLYDADKKRVKTTKQDKESYELYNASGSKLLDYIPSENKLTEYIYLQNKRVAQKEITLTTNEGVN